MTSKTTLFVCTGCSETCDVDEMVDESVHDLGCDESPVCRECHREAEYDLWSNDGHCGCGECEVDFVSSAIDAAYDFNR